MVMRTANLFGFVSASLMVMLLTLAPGLTRAADNQPLDPEEQAFLNQAMSDNAAQIAMARLALQKSQNQQVIDLANTVIQERQALDERLVQLLGPNAVSSPKPAANNDDAMASLQPLNGDAFDKAYAGLFVRDHNKIISAYECIKAHSSNLALRNVTRGAMPELRGNLMIALTMLRSPNWMLPSQRQQAVAAADTRTTKASAYLGEPLLTSIVTAPW
jgi:putative membrane protein